MLLSNEHRFIFVKTRKTASTSIEISMARYMRDPTDIITTITPEDEGQRAMFDVGPRNWEGPEGERIYQNHMTAVEIAELQPNCWHEYTCWTVERNPWSKCVSMFHWLQEYRSWAPGEAELKVGFKDWLLSERADLPINWWHYTIHDQLIIADVLRYEHLREELTKLCDRIGIPWDGWLPNAKSQFRPADVPYSAYYDDETRAYVAHVFRMEIQRWGYEFEEGVR